MSRSRRRRKPELIRTEDLKEITDLLGMEFAEKAIEPIRNALEFLESIRGSHLIPALPQVTMRSKTLHTILDTFRLSSPNRYDNALIAAGQLTGQSFADDMVEFLEKNDLIPQDEDVLIRIWMLFDTNAGWGTFKSTFDDVKKQIIISVEDCFLARGLIRDVTVHSSFLKGYMEGVSWELLKQYPRMFRRVFKVERHYLEPVSITREPKIENVWIFRVDLKEEELKLSFDYLYESKYASKREDYDTSILNARRALESAFKLKVELAPEEHVHLPDLFKIFRDYDVPFGYNIAKDVYGRTSRQIHGRMERRKEWCTKLVSDTASILKQIELYDMPQKHKEEIQKKIISLRGTKKS